MRIFFFLAICIGLSFQSIGQMDSFEAKADSIYALSKQNYFVADSLSKELIQEANSAGNVDQQLEAFYTAAKIASWQGFHEEAIQYYESLKSLALEFQKSTWTSKVMLRLSSSLLNSGQPEKALESCRNAYDFASLEADTVQMINALIGLAETYRKIDRLEYSVKYNREALSLSHSQSDENLWGRVYNNLGATLGEMEKNHEAIDTLRRALKMISPENIYAQSKFTTNIAYCFRNLGEYDSAIVYNKRAMILKKRSNEEVDLSYNEGAIGRAFQGLGMLDSAIYYTKMSREHAAEGNDPYRLIDANVHLSHAYYANKDYKNAFIHLNESAGLRDSIYADELDGKIEMLQRKYDLTKKEQEIERLNNEKAIAEEQSKFTSLVLSSLTILLTALVIIFVLIAKRRAEKNRVVALQLKMSNDEIEQNKKELKNFALDLMQKNQAIKKLSRELHDKEQTIANIQSSKADEIQELSDLKILTNEDWTRFKGLFEKVYPGFFNRMNTGEHEFTKGEKRLMTLVKLDMNNKEIADTLGISSDSVIKSRFRLKKKLALEEERGLNQFIHQM